MISLCLCGGMISGTSTSKTLGRCLVSGIETLLGKGREAAQAAVEYLQIKQICPGDFILYSQHGDCRT